MIAPKATAPKQCQSCEFMFDGAKCGILAQHDGLSTDHALTPEAVDVLDSLRELVGGLMLSAATQGACSFFVSVGPRELHGPESVRLVSEAGNGQRQYECETCGARTWSTSTGAHSAPE